MNVKRIAQMVEFISYAVGMQSTVISAIGIALSL